MNQAKQRRAHSMLQAMMLIISLVVVITSAIFTGLLVHYRTQDLIESADSRLLMVDELTREMLSPDYHDRIEDATSISKEQFANIVARNDDLCRRLHLQYLWSVLLVKDRLVFTSATHSDLNDPNSSCASFFETHRDPDAFAPAMQQELKPSYSSFKNEWGEGRQILIPRKDSRGRTYVFGASVQLTELNTLLRNTALASMGIGLAVMCGAFLFSLLLVRSFVAPFAKLTEAAGRMATGDLDAPLPSAGSSELQSLSTSLNEMRLDLKTQLTSLRKNEALLAQTQQIAHIGSWELDVATNRLIWSDETYHIFGLEPQKFGATHEAFLETVLPEDRAALEAAYFNSLRQGKDTYEIEHRIVHGSTGEIRHVHEKCIHERNASGEVIRSIGMVHDITERRRFEESLRESEETARAMLNATADAVVLINNGGTILAINQAMAARLGIQQQAVIGSSLHETIPERMRETTKAKIKNVVASGQPLRFEDSHTGSVLDISVYPVFDGYKNVRRVALFAHDITAQRKAEEALRQSYERLHAYFYLPLIGIATTNRKKGLLDINPKLCDMLGYDEAELRTKSWLDLAPVEDRNYENELYGHVISGETALPFTFEKRYRKKDGDIITAEITTDRVHGSTIDEDYFISFINDITDRKRADAALQAKNDELIHFNYTVSHDLKSPLVTIKTFLGYLEQDMAKTDPAHIAQDLGFIHGAADKMNALLEELLALSRIGRLVNPPVQASLQDIVQEALNLVMGGIAERGVRTQITEQPHLLYGDRVRLVEVFQNLVDNAVKFMGDQSDPLIEIGAETKDDRIMCFVRDNGMGIDPRHIKKLFGMFEKLNADSKGAGIGLALVKRIIEVHGGTIRVESEGLGKGACFWFTLPAKSSE